MSKTTLNLSYIAVAGAVVLGSTAAHAQLAIISTDSANANSVPPALTPPSPILSGGLATAPANTFIDGISSIGVSPDGSYWCVSGGIEDITGSNIDSDNDGSVFFGDGGTFTGAQYVAREDDTEIVDPDAPTVRINFWDGFDSQRLGTVINSSGVCAISGDTQDLGAQDDIVTTWDNGSSFFEVLAQEEGSADPVFAPDTGVQWDTLDSVRILADGRVAFRAEGIDGLTAGAAEDEAIILDNAVFLQKGVDIPGNQDGGATAAWENFDVGDFFFNSDGTEYIVFGDTDDANTGADDVIVVNGDVVLQEGVTPTASGITNAAGLGAATMNTFGTGLAMAGDGSYAFYSEADDPTDDVDFAVYNGEVVAREGEPVAAGSTDNWDQIRAVAVNSVGDYAIMGLDENSNTFVVLNGTTIVASSSTNVDFDGDGTIDTDRFLGDNPQIDELVLTDTQELYFISEVVDGSAVDVGDALLYYDLAPPNVPDVPTPWWFGFVVAGALLALSALALRRSGRLA